MHISHIKKLAAAVFFIALLLSALQCKKEVSADNSALIADSNNTARELALQKTKDSLIQDSIEKNRITYRTVIFKKNKKDSILKAFNNEYSSEERAIIYALNRLDSKNKFRADTLSVPDKFDKSLMIYTPFPRTLDQLKKVNKIAFFSYPIQAYALYENGNLVKWGPTSMGKKSAQTKRGLMFANWKKELAISTVDSEWKLPYNFNIHNTLGIGWHEYDLPGYPASHSCLRLLHDDAKFLYNWADTWILNKDGQTLKANGTPVIVFGDYAWGERKPWKYLESDSALTDISEKEMNSIIEPNLDKILSEQEKTQTVRKAQTLSSEAI